MVVLSENKPLSPAAWFTVLQCSHALTSSWLRGIEQGVWPRCRTHGG